MRRVAILIFFALPTCATSRYARFLNVDPAPGAKPNFMSSVNVAREYFDEAQPAKIADLEIEKKWSCVFISPQALDESARIRFERQGPKIILSIVRLSDSMPKLFENTAQPQVQEGWARLQLTSSTGLVVGTIRKTGDRLMIEGLSSEQGIRPALADAKALAPWYMDCER